MDTQKQNSFATTKTKFTLIELLVVIVIIAILGSAILAVSGAVGSQRDTSTCQANLNQLGKFYNDYQNANEWSYPTFAWVKNVSEYSAIASAKMQGDPEDYVDDGPFIPKSLTSSLVCPADESPELRDYVNNKDESTDVPSSYGHNLSIPAGDWTSTNIPDLSKIVVAFDASELIKGGNSINGPKLEEWNQGLLDKIYFNTVEYRHKDAANHLYLDGSVTIINSDEQADSLYDRQSNSSFQVRRAVRARNLEPRVLKKNYSGSHESN